MSELQFNINFIQNRLLESKLQSIGSIPIEVEKLKYKYINTYSEKIKKYIYINLKKISSIIILNMIGFLAYMYFLKKNIINIKKLTIYCFVDIVASSLFLLHNFYSSEIVIRKVIKEEYNGEDNESLINLINFFENNTKEDIENIIDKFKDWNKIKLNHKILSSCLVEFNNLIVNVKLQASHIIKRDKFFKISSVSLSNQMNYTIMSLIINRNNRLFSRISKKIFGIENYAKLNKYKTSEDIGRHESIDYEAISKLKSMLLRCKEYYINTSSDITEIGRATKLIVLIIEDMIKTIGDLSDIFGCEISSSDVETSKVLLKNIV